VKVFRRRRGIVTEINDRGSLKCTSVTKKHESVKRRGGRVFLSQVYLCNYAW